MTGVMVGGSDSFGLGAADYDAWYESHRREYLCELAALRKAAAFSGRGLEVGVGTGRFAAPLGISFGLDPSRRMLEFARKRGVAALQGVGESLPFASGVFDLVLLVAVLCFARAPEMIIVESRRVLRPGGRLIAGIIDRESRLGALYRSRKEPDGFYAGARFFSASEALSLLPAGRWSEISVFQTVFPPGKVEAGSSIVRRGHGEGAFVVIAARKAIASEA